MLRVLIVEAVVLGAQIGLRVAILWYPPSTESQYGVLLTESPDILYTVSTVPVPM